MKIAFDWIFPNSHDFVLDWANHFHYLYIFIIGFIIASNTTFEKAITHNKQRALIFAISTTILILFSTFIPLDDLSQINIIFYYVIGSIIWAFCEWCWLVAILGYGKRILVKDKKWIKYFREIALPFYIFHQTVIIILAYYIIQIEMIWVFKFLIISGVALVVTILLCEVIKTNNITRLIFGMKKKPNLGNS